MATENTPQPAAVAPAPVAPAVSAIKPASSKTGLIVVAVIIGILVLTGVGVGGYFAVKALFLGEDSPLRNAGKTEAQLAADALTAGADNVALAMTSDGDDSELDNVTNTMPPAVQTFMAGRSVSSVPAADRLITSDEGGLQSYVVNYDVALDSSEETLSADISGKYTQAEDSMEVVLNSTGAIDLSGTPLDIQADVTARMVDNDSYFKIENIQEETVSTGSEMVVMLAMQSSGLDLTTLTSEDVAYINSLSAAGAEGFTAAYTNQWIQSEGTSSSEEDTSTDTTDSLTSAQQGDLSTLYTDTFGTANAEYVGKETLEGETVYHWDYNLTSDDMDTFAKESCQIIDEDGVTCGNNDFSQYMDLQNLEVWVNENGELRKVSTTMEIDLGEVLTAAEMEGFSSTETLTVEATLWLTDINSASDVEAPEDFITYDAATEIFNSYLEGLF